MCFHEFFPPELLKNFWPTVYLLTSHAMFYFGLSRKPFIYHIHTYFGFTKKKILIVYLYLYFLGQKICLFPNGSLSWWRIVDHSPRQRYANKEYIFYDYILVSRKMIFFFQVILMISLQDFTWLVLSAP